MPFLGFLPSISDILQTFFGPSQFVPMFFLASEFGWSGRSSLLCVLSKNILLLSPAHRFAWENSGLKTTTFMMFRSTSNKRKQPSVFFPNLIV